VKTKYKKGVVRNCLIVILVFFTVCMQEAYSSDAPVTTAGTVSTAGSTAIVPVTATNFTYIGSIGLEIHYDPAVANATSVTIGTGVGGNLNTNLTIPGVIIIGWYTYPAVTISGSPVIFNINFSKVLSGTTTVSWFDDGYSCYYSDGSYNILNDSPTTTFYISGSLTFQGSLVADFSANNTTPPKNTTVQFTDLTTGGPTSWDWSFNRTSVVYVGGTNANSQNPQVQFTEGGLYTVTLVAHNAGNNSTKIKTDYIRAGTAGLWTGTTSSDWMTTTNWDNWLIPGSTTDVIIPFTATNWPVYAGNLTLGTTCKSITLDGTAHATISGNLTIGSGYSLVFTSNGVMHVGGNWTNAGIFTAGTGTVDFTGSNAASMISAGSPTVINNFYNVIISKSIVALTIQAGMLVNVNGNLVINIP
jgi:PKD repeat protein